METYDLRLPNDKSRGPVTTQVPWTAERLPLPVVLTLGSIKNGARAGGAGRSGVPDTGRIAGRLPVTSTFSAGQNHRIFRQNCLWPRPLRCFSQKRPVCLRPCRLLPRCSPGLWPLLMPPLPGNCSASSQAGNVEVFLFAGASGVSGRRGPV